MNFERFLASFLWILWDLFRDSMGLLRIFRDFLVSV